MSLGIDIPINDVTVLTVTVVIIEKATMIIVNVRYLMTSGVTMLVGGMISVSSNRNTVKATNTDMHNWIFWWLSQGR